MENTPYEALLKENNSEKHNQIVINIIKNFRKQWFYCISIKKYVSSIIIVKKYVGTYSNMLESAVEQIREVLGL